MSRCASFRWPAVSTFWLTGVIATPVASTFAHGEPATKVKHQHPQIALLTLILPQPLERTARPGQVPPMGRKERSEQLPIFISRIMDCRVIDSHPRTIAATTQTSQQNKLTHMGRSIREPGPVHDWIAFRRLL